MSFENQEEIQEEFSQKRFRFGEWLFHNCFSLYVPVYGLYKKCTNRLELKLMKKTIRESSIVLDVGANIGFFSILFSELVGPKGEVHAFEPEELNFKLLKKRVQEKENIFVYQMAAADRSGTLKLYKSDLNIDHRTYDDGRKKEAAEVEAIAIDDRFKNRRVDFIKMDVEGFEYRALMGMQETLKNNPGLTLCVEWWPYGLKKAGASGQAVLDLISELGFQVKMIGFENRALNDISACTDWQKHEMDHSIYFNLWCKRSFPDD